MNNIIKTVYFALLFSIPTAYGMKKKQIVVSPTFKQFSISTIQTDGVLDDISKEIFKHACSNNIKAIATFRSVCKHWYHLFNPTTIKTLHSDFEDCKAYFLSLIKDNQKMIKIEKNQDYALFLLDMIQDATVYEELLPQAIQYNFPQFTQLLLEKGARIDIEKLTIAYYSNGRGYNHYNGNILFGDKYKEMFTLLLQNDIDIHAPLSPINETIMYRAQRDALSGIGLIATLPVTWPIVILTEGHLLKVGIPSMLCPVITILNQRYRRELFALGLLVMAFVMYSNFQ